MKSIKFFWPIGLLVLILSHLQYAFGSQSPTDGPTKMPTDFAVPTKNPTRRPTKSPTSKPSRAPTTRSPTSTAPTTAYPTTGGPTAVPTTAKPSTSPTESPTKTRRPTRTPTMSPSESPVVTPRPTKEPTFNDCENYQGIWYNDANKIYLDCKSGYRCGQDISLLSMCFLEGTQNQTQLCATNPVICYRNSDCPSGRRCLKEDFCGKGRCFQYDESNLTPYPTKKPTTTPTTSNPTVSPTKNPTQNPTTFMPTLSPTPGNKTVEPSTITPTRNPTLKVADSDLSVWQEFYDATGGSTWTSCSNTRDAPCNCNDKENLRYVVCESTTASSRDSGRLLRPHEESRELQTNGGVVHITQIHLRNNNIKGTGGAMPFAKLEYLTRLDLASDQNSATPNNIQSTSVTNCEEFKYCYVPGIQCEFDGSGNDLCLKNWGIDPKFVLFAAGTSFGALIACCCCYGVGRKVRRGRRRNVSHKSAESPDDEMGTEPETVKVKKAGLARTASAEEGTLTEPLTDDPSASLLPGVIKRKKSLFRTASSKRLSGGERHRFKRVESLYEVGMLNDEEVVELVPDFFDIQAHSNMYTRKSSVRWVDKEGEKVPAGPISHVIKITDYENESKGEDSVPVPLDSDEIVNTFRFKDEKQATDEFVIPSLRGDDEYFRPQVAEIPLEEPSVEVPQPPIQIQQQLQQQQEEPRANAANIELDSSSDDDDNSGSDVVINDSSQFRTNASRRASNASSVSSATSSAGFMTEDDIMQLVAVAESTGQRVPEDKRPPVSKVQFMLENDIITPDQAALLCPEFDHLSTHPGTLGSSLNAKSLGESEQDEAEKEAEKLRLGGKSVDGTEEKTKTSKRLSIASIMSSGSTAKPKAKAERSDSIVQQALAFIGVDDKQRRKRSLSKQLERKTKLDTILSNPEIFTSFVEEHSRFFKAEHVLFWNSVDRFEKYRNLAVRNKVAYQKMAQTIIDDFVKDGSPNQVILPEPIQNAILTKSPEQYNPEMFVEAKREIMRAMNIDFLGMMQKSTDKDMLDEIIDQFDILVGDIAEKNREETANKELEKISLPETNIEKHDDDSRVDILMGMGFTKRQSLKSLKAHNGDVDAAAQDLIFNHNNDDKEDEGNINKNQTNEAKTDASETRQNTFDDADSVANRSPLPPPPGLGSISNSLKMRDGSISSSEGALPPVPVFIAGKDEDDDLIPAKEASKESEPSFKEAFVDSEQNNNTTNGDDEEEKQDETPTHYYHEEASNQQVSVSNYASVEINPSPLPPPPPPGMRRSEEDARPISESVSSVGSASKITSLTQKFSSGSKPSPPPPPPGLSLPSTLKSNNSSTTIATSNTSNIALPATTTPKPPAPSVNTATKPITATSSVPAATAASKIVVPSPTTPSTIKKATEPSRPAYESKKPTAMSSLAISEQVKQGDDEQPASPVAAAIKKFSANASKPTATSPTSTTKSVAATSAAKPATAASSATSINTKLQPSTKPPPPPATPPPNFNQKKTADASANDNSNSKVVAPVSLVKPSALRSVTTTQAVSTASSTQQQPPLPSVLSSPPDYNPNMAQQQQDGSAASYYNQQQQYYDPNQYGNGQQGYNNGYYDPNQQLQQQQQYPVDQYGNSYQGYQQDMSVFDQQAMGLTGGVFAAQEMSRVSGAKPAQVRQQEGIVSKQKQFFLEKQAQLSAVPKRPTNDPVPKVAVKRDSSWWKAR